MSGDILLTDSTQVLSSDALRASILAALAGSEQPGESHIVWRDRAAEIVLDLTSLRVQTKSGLVVVAIETESAEFGRAPLIVRFVVAEPDGASTLVGATDENAHGHPSVVARWGDLFRDVVWAAMVRKVVAHAEGLDAHPRGVCASDQGLHIEIDIRGVIEVVEEHRRHGPERDDDRDRDEHRGFLRRAIDAVEDFVEDITGRGDEDDES